MMNEMKTGVYFYNNESFNFDFVTSLTMSNKVRFVNSVTDTVVGNNYNSLIRDMMFDHMIVQLFTNVGNFYFKDADDVIDAIENFLEEANVVDIVKVNMNDGILDELNKAVDKAIEYRTGIHTNPINEALASLLSTLENKINEVDLSSMMEMAQKFASMTDGFTPDSIVNAYMNSDVRKKNLEEIEESKRGKTEIAKNLDKAIKEVDTKTNAEIKPKEKANKKK